MGIDFHGLNLLRHAKRGGDFGRTITVGRQGVHVSEELIRRTLVASRPYSHSDYCEPLLEVFFGSSSVHSIDNSDYENATIIHDMNKPLPAEFFGQYDTVIDYGTSEHIFNATQALLNYSLLCRPGGRIIHYLPANNLCGHGFWQFSPELSFSLYSGANGYSDTSVFLADLSNNRVWYKVKAPRDGRRVNVWSHSPVYVLAMTTLAGGDFSHDRVQQSDYVYAWTGDAPKEEQSAAKQRVKNSPILYALAKPGYEIYLRQKASLERSRERLSGANPGLEIVNLRALV